MMVLWEKKQIGVKELGKKLFLDSGTLTPLLKKLEKKGFITRERSKEDERNLIVTITVKGAAMKKKALSIPAQLGACIKLSAEETGTLYTLLYKLLEQM
jgi:DNA-binding MarR family transcriptional regulator